MAGGVSAQGRKCRCRPAQSRSPPAPRGKRKRGGDGTTHTPRALPPRLLDGAGGNDGRRWDQDGEAGWDGGVVSARSAHG
eukprot:2118942-Pleurochrysis_carterae.AAC.4